MGKLIDANGTQASLGWSQINWPKVEKSVLRLQQRIFMAKVKGDVKGMESLQRLLASSRTAKLLAIRKVGQESSGRKTPGIDGVVSLTDADRERLFKDGLSLKDYVPMPVRRVFIPTLMASFVNRRTLECRRFFPSIRVRRGSLLTLSRLLHRRRSSHWRPP